MARIVRTLRTGQRETSRPRSKQQPRRCWVPWPQAHGTCRIAGGRSTQWCVRAHTERVGGGTPARQRHRRGLRACLVLSWTQCRRSRRTRHRSGMSAARRVHLRRGLFPRDAGDADLAAVEARLNAERAPGTTLTSEAVADRDTPRVLLHRPPELTAAPRRLSLRHGHTVDRRIRRPQRTDPADRRSETLRRPS
jgi:hypothetical protein